MKKIITVLLISISTYSFSQSCTDVEELLRKRHTISGMTYGHPYTMFVKLLKPKYKNDNKNKTT